MAPASGYWGSIQNAKISAETLNLLRSKGFKNADEVEVKYKEVNNQFDTTLSSLKNMESQIKQLTELQTQLRIYGRTKDTYVAFSKARNKEKFIIQNSGVDGQVMLHETARKHLNAYKKEYGVVPSSKEIKSILEALQTNKTIKYEEYRIIKAERDELTRLHINLQKITSTPTKERVWENAK